MSTLHNSQSKANIKALHHKINLIVGYVLRQRALWQLMTRATRGISWGCDSCQSESVKWWSGKIWSCSLWYTCKFDKLKVTLRKLVPSSPLVVGRMNRIVPAMCRCFSHLAHWITAKLNIFFSYSSSFQSSNTSSFSLSRILLLFLCLTLNTLRVCHFNMSPSGCREAVTVSCCYLPTL